MEKNKRNKNKNEIEKRKKNFWKIFKVASVCSMFIR